MKDLSEVELHQKFNELEGKIESHIVEREDRTITLNLSVGERIDLMRMNVL